MKKIKLLSALLILLGIGAKAQCPKYVLLEHFTQASCAPCAAQNPGFVQNISLPNKKILKQIAYHVWWPGNDTMFDANPLEIYDRTQFYKINTIPNVILNGNEKKAAPSGFSQFDIDAAWAQTSPVKILVSKVDSSTFITVKITVKTVGKVPAGSFKLLAAVIEKEVVFAKAPGNNNEKTFPNVFRRWLDSTSTDSTLFTLPAKGASVTRTYKLHKDSTWKADQLDVIAFLQNTSNNNILNAGSTTDIATNITFLPPAVHTKAGSSGNASTFNFLVGNSGDSTETFSISLIAKNAPAGWQGKLTIGGISSSIKGSSSSLLFDAEFPADTAFKKILLSVIPDASSGFASYTFSIKSKRNPDAPELVVTVNVISNVTDLIVSSVNGFGDPGITGNPSKFEKIYTEALSAAGSKTYAATSNQVFVSGSRDNALINVKNIYYNTGWSFPSMGDDSLIAAFTKHLTLTKKRLFISGQDLGWETWDEANGAPATPASQIFYTEFLNANWFGDGSPETFGVYAEKTDNIFGKINSSLIDTSVYHAKYTYPDQIDALGKGKVILNYSGLDSLSLKAGVRAEDPGKYKTVYLGVGLEQIQDANVRSAIIKNAYNWFNDIITTIGYDEAMAKLSLGQNYPNPSALGFTQIPLGNVNKEVTLQVLDVMGRILAEQKIAKGSTSTILNTSALEAGIYLYRLVDGKNITSAKTMQVIR